MHSTSIEFSSDLYLGFYLFVAFFFFKSHQLNFEATNQTIRSLLQRCSLISLLLFIALALHVCTYPVINFLIVLSQSLKSLSEIYLPKTDSAMEHDLLACYGKANIYFFSFCHHCFESFSVLKYEKISCTCCYLFKRLRWQRCQNKQETVIYWKYFV